MNGAIGHEKGVSMEIQRARLSFCQNSKMEREREKEGLEQTGWQGRRMDQWKYGMGLVKERSH